MVVQIDRNRLRELLRDGAQLIDVLPTQEYEAEHIPEAINIPLKILGRDVSRSDDARDHCLRGSTGRACGLAPASAEESDDATAHVPLGEVNVRHGRGVLQSVAKLIGNGLRAAVDLGFEPALANRGDRARSNHLLVT